METVAAAPLPGAGTHGNGGVLAFQQDWSLRMASVIGSDPDVRAGCDGEAAAAAT